MSLSRWAGCIEATIPERPARSQRSGGQAGGRGAAYGLAEVRRAERLYAAIAARVDIRLAEPGGAGAESPVEEHLHAADPQPIADALRRRDATAQTGGDGLVERVHGKV